MIINRKKNTIRGVVFGYISKIVSVLFPFAIRTIIIHTLGRDYIGLNSLFTSILTILSLADLGFGTALVFSMYKPIAEDDTETMNALLNLYRKIYRVVGAIVLVAGLLVMPALPYLINGSYPADINLYTLYLVYLINNVIGYFFFAYKSSLLSAHQRNDVSSKINIIVQTIMYVCQIAVLLLFKNYYVYIIFLPLSTLGINLYTAYITKKMFPQYFCKGTLGKEIKSDIKKKITALLTHKIGYVIQASIDNICLSAFVGLAFLSMYNNYFYIVSAIQGFITIIKQSMLAGIGNSIIVETAEYNKKQFYKHLLFFDWLATWCTCCFLCLFQPFIKVWIGQENVMAFSIVICLCILFFSDEMRAAIGLYKDALGMWWEDRFKPIAISLVNLVGTIVCAYFGFYEGVVLTTAVAYSFVGLPWETHVFYKYYMKEKPTKYYAKQLFYTAVCVGTAALTYFICSLIPLYGIRLIVVRFIICLFVPNVVMFIIYYSTNQLNRDGFNKGVKKLMGKIRNKIKKVYYNLPWSPATYNIKALNKRMRCYQKMDKKYSQFIDKTIKCESEPSNYVFSCWLQGEDQAPDIVKACFASMRKQFADKKLVIITSENMKEYVDFPEHIIKKWKDGKITNTHFSDILRAALLAKYGGLWVDSTVLSTGSLDRYVDKNTDLFVYSNTYRGDDSICLSSWLIYAKPNNPIIVNTRNLLYKYWEKNNKLADYYLFHVIFTLCARTFPEEWEKVKFVSNLNPHLLLFLNFYNEYDEKRMEELKQISNFHKLTYKIDKSRLKPNSFYEKICRGGGY